MAEGNGANNTAIVAIIGIVILILALLYFTGVFNHDAGMTTGNGDRTTLNNVETPATNSTTSPASRSPTR